MQRELESIAQSLERIADAMEKQKQKKDKKCTGILDLLEWIDEEDRRANRSR